MKLKKIWEKIVVLIYGGIPPGVLAKSCYEEFVAEYGWIYTEENNMMTEKRFDVVMNEFDEVEYITDIVDCEDRDFADFIEFANEMAKENEQLKQELFESEKDCLLETYNDNPVRRDEKIESLKEEFKERFRRGFE